EGPLFTARKEKAISNNRIQKLMKEYVQKATIELTITPHILRHTFASHLNDNETDILVIQSLI
ncbi:MAG: tyrosine-type recombinase/integrase, partial [Bacteroidetes bacterium]|nr:tyrosine-type recombinase/integrase [Bacteroidota bacterium]